MMCEFIREAIQKKLDSQIVILGGELPLKYMASAHSS